MGTPRPLILEIGCNDGVDSLRFLQLFPEARLYCFDPEPRATRAWRERMAAYVAAGRCELDEIALSCASGEAPFHQSSGTTAGAHKQDWDLSGSLNPPTGHLEQSPWCKFERTITVTTRTLDEVAHEKRLLALPLDGSPAIDLIWLDVQGGERNVLLGGPQTLAVTRYLYLEFNHWRKPLYAGQMNLQQTLDQLGDQWEPLGIYEGYNLLARNRRYGRTAAL